MYRAILAILNIIQFTNFLQCVWEICSFRRFAAGGTRTHNCDSRGFVQRAECFYQLHHGPPEQIKTKISSINKTHIINYKTPNKIFSIFGVWFKNIITLSFFIHQNKIFTDHNWYFCYIMIFLYQLRYLIFTEQSANSLIKNLFPLNFFTRSQIDF